MNTRLLWLLGGIVAGGLLALLLVWPRPVPASSFSEPTQPSKVERVPPRTPATQVETLRDITVFDLRKWAAPSSATPEVPFRMTNVLTFRKIKPVDSLVVHYSTGGSRIEFRCVFPRCSTFRAESEEHPDERNYAVAFHVSDIPERREFPALVEAIYWNGFVGPTAERASTYTSSNTAPLQELGLAVLVPEDKPFRGIDLFADEEWVADTSFTAADTYAYWRIQQPKPVTHYTMVWAW